MKKLILTSLIVFALCLGMVFLAEAKVLSMGNTTVEDKYNVMIPVTGEWIDGVGLIHTIWSTTIDGKGFTHIKCHTNAKFSGLGWVLTKCGYALTGVTYEGKVIVNSQKKVKSSPSEPGFHFTSTIITMLKGSDGSSFKLHTTLHIKTEKDGTINTFMDDTKIMTD